MRKTLILGAVGFLLGCGWLGWWVQTSSHEDILLTTSERQPFLAELGWEDYVCVATDTIRLPAQVDQVFQPYVALQESQNLPLTAHLGEEVTRFRYEKESSSDRIIELLFEDDLLLAGAVYQKDAPQKIEALLVENVH